MKTANTKTPKTMVTEYITSVSLAMQRQLHIGLRKTRAA